MLSVEMCARLVSILAVIARPCLVAGAGAIGHHTSSEPVVDTEATIGFSPLPASIPFFMLGDFGGAPGSLSNGGDLAWKQAVAYRMGFWAEALLPRFVVGLGDNFYDRGVDTANDAAWDEQFESVYSADALQRIPWLMCLGNHDYIGRPEAQIQRTAQDTSGRWYMPSRAYSRRFTQGSVSVEIFSVDTNAISYTLSPETAGSCAFAEPVPGCSNRFEEEGGRVTAELERLLNASTASWKVVAGHHPLYSAGHHGSARETAPLRAALLPLLDRYGVHLYACGHDHVAQHILPYEQRPQQRSAAGDADTNEEEQEKEEEEKGTVWSVAPNVSLTEPSAPEPAAVSRGRTTDHVTIGTSGPMVMQGGFDFRYEEGGDAEGYLGREEERGAPPASNSVSPIDRAEGGVAATNVTAAVEDGVKAQHTQGTFWTGGDEQALGVGFEIWFATKRRAFGVLEASEHLLRVSLVGKDGEVLYTFVRAKSDS